MSHPAGCGSAFPTIACNAPIFLLDLEKKPSDGVKTFSHSSCVTCFYFLSPCSVPFFSFSYFPWLDFTLAPCQQIPVPMAVREGQVISWEIVPQTQRFLYEMKAVYWLREIHLFCNVMELGWPWNILMIMLLAAPSNLQWEGQEKIWISLARWFIGIWK